MLYRETGQFKTTYESDQRIFRIVQDRWIILAILAAALLVVPFVATPYAYTEILIPFLILSLAAVGLNILVGYCGQVSLGTGAFMAVGAYAAYNLWLRVPEINNLIVVFLFGGLMAAAVGIVFGLPSLRIKGFYLAVATLAAQFFLDWVFARVGWFTNHTASGSVAVGDLSVFGLPIATPEQRYFLILGMVIFLTIVALNLVRGQIGRTWMAIRDMDIAAELIGIRPLNTKLSAFAISSFYCGISGALWSFCYINSVESSAFDIFRSFMILFMVIVGGLGSVLGSFLGAFFIFLLPIALNNAVTTFGLPIATETITHIEFMAFGGLIVFFLIVEPLGLARLWQIAKEKLRLWPFPY